MSQLSEKAIEASRLVAGLINRWRAGRRERFYYFEDNAGDDDDDDDDINNDSGDMMIRGVVLTIMVKLIFIIFYVKELKK